MSPAAYVIHVFGGVRETARRLGRDKSRVARWKQSGLVPGRLHPRVLEIAGARGLDITPHDLIYGRELEAKAQDAP